MNRAERRRAHRDNMAPTYLDDQPEFVVIGGFVNDEEYPCILCGDVPEFVHQNVYLCEAGDTPEGITIPTGKKLIMPYRLCGPCNDKHPEQWKIRLALLAKFADKRSRGLIPKTWGGAEISA